jgi:hypothetical protein
LLSRFILIVNFQFCHFISLDHSFTLAARLIWLLFYWTCLLFGRSLIWPHEERVHFCIKEEILTQELINKKRILEMLALKHLARGRCQLGGVFTGRESVMKNVSERQEEQFIMICKVWREKPTA